MARHTRIATLTAMKEIGLIPVFYNGDFEVVKNVATACAKGGAKAIEFTNRGDQAHLVFGELVRRFYDDDRAILDDIVFFFFENYVSPQGLFHKMGPFHI